jgi:hypothetical protein
VVFREVADGVTLPYFELARDQGGNHGTA